MFLKALPSDLYNAWTVLNGLGGTTETDILIPGGHSKIKQILVSGVGGTTAGAANMSIRLSGNAMVGNQKIIPFGLHIIGGTNTSNWSSEVTEFLCDFDVAPGNQLRIEASINGADVGTSEVAVTIYTC